MRQPPIRAALARLVFRQLHQARRIACKMELQSVRQHSGQGLARGAVKNGDRSLPFFKILLATRRPVDLSRLLCTDGVGVRRILAISHSDQHTVCPPDWPERWAMTNDRTRCHLLLCITLARARTHSPPEPTIECLLPDKLASGAISATVVHSRFSLSGCSHFPGPIIIVGSFYFICRIVAL